MFISRELTPTFNKLQKTYLLLALVGARQSGKTTFLKEQMKQVRANYLLFDDPDVKEMFEEDIKKFEKQYVEGYDLCIFDEVQYCKNAGIKLKYLAEKGKKIWLTSSSEVLLGKEILSYLVGRVTVVRMYPFSIQEFLWAANQKEVTSTILKRMVWEHLLFGGYPKVVITEDSEMKKTILQDLYETMILKDVAKTFSIADIKSLEDFSHYLSINSGNIFSYDTACRDLQSSFPTLKKYIEAFEKSYLIIKVPPFFTNKNKEIAKQPKIYFLDTGLRNAIARTFPSEPEGKLFENYVLSELLKLGFHPRYWRTKAKAEVDFVLERENKLIPLEIKIKLEPENVERSLRSFIQAYHPSLALVVGYDGKKGETKTGNCKIVFTDILGMRELLGKTNLLTKP